jgi:hypothetical protein
VFDSRVDEYAAHRQPVLCILAGTRSHRSTGTNKNRDPRTEDA